MANNYTDFSFMLPLPEGQYRAELAAFVAAYEAEKAAAGKGLFGADDAEEATRVATSEVAPEGMNEDDWYLQYAGVDYQVEEHGLWVSAQNSEGNVDAAVLLARRFLTHFGLDNHGVVIEWACTCSKPRLGEFYGGAVLVTTEDEYVVNPGDFCAQEAQRRQVPLLKTC